MAATAIAPTTTSSNCMALLHAVRENGQMLLKKRRDLLDQ
jgi:hypothetical protein